MISKVTNLIVVLLIATFSVATFATSVEFAQDDLPTESVIPVLDSNMAVKKKLIPFSHRFELGLTYGSIIDEMFFNNTLLGIQASYYLSEDQGLGIKYQSRMSGLSTYSDQFSQSSQHLQFSEAPEPTTIITANYHWTFLYGKVSFGKTTILPTTLYLDADLGMNKFGGQDLPYSAIGMGQKFFIQKHWGVFLTYRIMLYQIIDPVSAKISSSAPTPSESDFDKKIQVSQGIDLGLSYLF